MGTSGRSRLHPFLTGGQSVASIGGGFSVALRPGTVRVSGPSVCLQWPAVPLRYPSTPRPQRVHMMESTEKAVQVCNVFTGLAGHFVVGVDPPPPPSPLGGNLCCPCYPDPTPYPKSDPYPYPYQDLILGPS